jgi:rod shape-determining protein MreC
VPLLDIRQRAGYLFLGVMLGHIVLISAQLPSRRPGVPVLQEITFGVFAEVQRGASAIVSTFRGMWSGYIGLRDVRAENESLKQQLLAAQLALQEQRALADRSRGLIAALELRDRTNLKTIAAEVIGAGAAPEFRTLTIDKGTGDGLRTDMAVISPAGVVGRIVVPTARAAKVQLLIDRNAAAGALVERTRAQGVVVGAGEDMLRMEYVSELAEIVAGDVLVTSGIDDIYPKGFVIGKVERVEKSGMAYKQILVRPAVDFSSLEEVIVVLTPTPAREAEGSGP